MGQTASTLKRILFVDDDPNVLNGLRNVLRTKRREWDMVFAIGPDEALAKVAEGPFDVVVSDMRMPRMDGATLLSKIKQIQPKAVRMILSGQTELESVMKSVFIAHMFLSKPCDPALLQQVVERACRLQAILGSDELRAEAGKVEMLPAAPKTYVALNEVLMAPNCSVAAVARIIERDVGLCAKLLQLVNSAFFGLPRKISSLGETVTYLGIVTIKNLALALETFSTAAGSSGLSEAALLALQSHSLLTGQIARQIEAKDPKKAEESFLAGVLHEVGWLVEPKATSGPKPDSPVDRTLLGAYLLGLWGLPHPIMEAVAYHKEPHLLAHSAFELVDLIYIADHLATEMASGTGVEQKLDLDYLAALGIDEARLLQMRAVAEKVARATKDDSSEDRHA
jgi:HD-like signal output (HDOD) protein/CheY-like chemotaxis protein